MSPFGVDRSAGRGIGKMREDARRILLEARKGIARHDMRPANTFAGGLMEQGLQGSAVDGELRPAISASRAPRLGPDLLAMPVEEGGLFDRCGHPVRGEQAELEQLADGARLEVDAKAQSLNPWGGLEALGLNARGVQAECYGQPTNSAADDDDPHAGLSLQHRCGNFVQHGCSWTGFFIDRPVAIQLRRLHGLVGPRIGRRLKLRDLHVLLAVAECGGMARAAEKLAITHPYVSEDHLKPRGNARGATLTAAPAASS